MSEKLTPTQEKVMSFLRGGHHAHRWYGQVVFVNGGRLCTTATMRALVKRGLVVECGRDEWKVAGPDLNERRTG